MWEQQQLKAISERSEGAGAHTPGLGMASRKGLVLPAGFWWEAS